MKSFILLFSSTFVVLGQINYNGSDGLGTSGPGVGFQYQDLLITPRETRQSQNANAPRRASRIRFEDSPDSPPEPPPPQQRQSSRPSSPFLFESPGSTPLKPESQPQFAQLQLQNPPQTQPTQTPTSTTPKPRSGRVLFETDTLISDRNIGNLFQSPSLSPSQPHPQPHNAPSNAPSFNFGPASPAPASTATTKPCADVNGRQGVCQEYVKCSLHQPDYVEKKNRAGINIKCPLSHGRSGICCRTVLKNKEIDASIFIRKKAKHENSLEMRLGGAGVVQTQIDQAVTVNQIKQLEQQHLVVENRLLHDKNKSSVVKKGTASHGHLLFFQTSRKAIEMSHFGYTLMESSRDISKRLNVADKAGGEGLLKYNLLQSSGPKSKCPRTPVCDPNDSKLINYRSADGTCNNLRVTNLGSAFTPLMRVLEPEYADGVWSPRIGRGGLPLPSARLLSSSLIGDRDSPDLRFSLHVMQFGQFVDHDLSHVPVYRFGNGEGIECCNEGGRGALPLGLKHPFCLPIEISSQDTSYRRHHQSCMNFVRSMIAPRLDCSFGYADQLNQITHWLDSSNVYGSSKEDEKELRLFRDGKLKATAAGRFAGHGPGLGRKEHLPLQEQFGDECTVPEFGIHCFKAGDARVNEMIGLTATHLIWLREHNRLASELKMINPAWNDKQLYLEARRILNAEYQHILYNEWLPIVIGSTYMEVYGLLPLTQGYAYDYDDRIDPSVSNAFAAAAFRMGHTLIQGILQLINELGVVDEHLAIHEHFNNPFRIREEGLLDKVLRTLSTEPIQAFDILVTSEVTQRLFQPQHEHFGMDLIALNIQRGRDHGIPGYNHYRHICKIGRVESFRGFADWIPLNFIELLTKSYNHVDDVDLFIGGIAERPLPGALLGPTFTCIIGDQFARSKKADRFAYDLGGKESSFTPGQLDQIRRVSYARVLCDNSDRITKLQPFAFLVPDGEFNQLQPCESLPRLDLSYWRQ